MTDSQTAALTPGQRLHRKLIGLTPGVSFRPWGDLTSGVQAAYEIIAAQRPELIPERDDGALKDV